MKRIVIRWVKEPYGEFVAGAPGSVALLCSFRLWIVIACFVSSVAVLGLYTVPWSSMISCVFWAMLAEVCSRPQWSQKQRLLHFATPVALCLASVWMHPYVAATLTAGWLRILSGSSDHKDAWVLRHFAFAILMFEVVELMLLKHGMVNLWFTDLVHTYSQLIRESHGGGGIVGPLQIDYRLLVFTVVAAMPLTFGVGHRLLLPVCQILVVIAAIPLRAYPDPALAVAIPSLSACVLINLMRGANAHGTQVVQEMAQWRTRGLQAVRWTGRSRMCDVLQWGS